MNSIAIRYRAEILRAVFGSYANEGKVSDLHRLNQLCEHLAQCEQAQEALRAKGYGRTGMLFVEVVCEVPTNGLGRLKHLFAPNASPIPYADLGEVDDNWSMR
jgi:hypothetical protein